MKKGLASLGGFLISSLHRLTLMVHKMRLVNENKF